MSADLLIDQAVTCLKQGKIIAYPTEAVFGLGCDPHNLQALEQLLQLKQRSAHKGFILIASHIEQLLPYLALEELPSGRWNEIIAQWPGPYTWICPAKSAVSPLLRGDHATLAVRVTAHPVAKALCEQFEGAIVSTSANLSTQMALRTSTDVIQLFGAQIAGVVVGELGGSHNPTSIRHAITGELLRAG